MLAHSVTICRWRHKLERKQLLARSELNIWMNIQCSPPFSYFPKKLKSIKWGHYNILHTVLYCRAKFFIIHTVIWIKQGCFFKSPHISKYFCPKTSPKDIPMLLLVLTLTSKVSWRPGVSLIVGLWCALLPGCWCRSGLCFLQICPIQEALPIKFMQIDTTTNQTLASSFDLFRR